MAAAAALTHVNVLSRAHSVTETMQLRAES
jgi:hypothetical protein